MIYEKLSAEERKKLQAQSKQKFAVFYEKTLCAYGLTESQAPCSRGFQKCWNDVLKVLENQTAAIRYDIIYMALYHITWNTYPVSGLSAAKLELLALVEEALIEEGYAYEVWSESYIFNRAMDLIGKSTSIGSPRCLCHSAWFGRYVYANTCYEVVLKNGKVKLHESRIGWIGLNMFESTYSVRNTILVFEAAIKRLIPSATNWTRQEWTNEAHILREIQKVHGINYSQNYEDFDNLMDVFDRLLNGADYDRSLMLLDQVPLSIATSLWPNNALKNLERFFVRICNRTRKQMKINPCSQSAFRKDILTNSWVWVHFNGTNTPPPKVKQQIFNVMLGV